MTKLHSHSVFQEPEDRYNWDKYLEQLKLIKLSKSQRQRAVQALQYLRCLFGESFLRKCFDTGHPLYADFLNSAPLARLRLTHFAESLQAFENAEGFVELVKRLKKANEFLETATVLETADKFRKTRFTIIFEPSVEITTTTGIKRNKNPDLKIVNQKTTEELFVEVSRLRPSDKQVISENSFNTIWWLIYRAMSDSTLIIENHETNEQIHQYILPHAHILQDLEKDDLATIVPKIEILIQKVYETNEFQELIIKDKIEVAISPWHDHSKAEEWAQKRGIRDLVRSPPVPLGEIHRARVKIGDKIRQLPQHTPGIIVIPTHETLLFFAYDINQVINEIESELLQYPQLLCVVLYVEVGESPKEPITVSVDDHLFIKKMRGDFMSESKIIIANPAFNLHISDSAMKRITQTFIKY